MNAKLLIVTAPFFAMLAAGSAAGQSCEDFDECTTNDMCADGMCIGTPRNGGSCDDGNDCTTNDTCVSGTCQGTPAASGTSCNQGCGSCFSQLGFAFCLPDEGSTGNSCDDGSLCTVNDRCRFGFCLGDQKCNAGDGDPCTFNVCNPFDGSCSDTSFDPCGDCASCQPSTDPNNPLPFECSPASNGASCDDFNECTGDGTCEAGDCVDAPPATPGGPTPTATASPTTPPVATATATLPPVNTATPTATEGAAGTPTPTNPPSGCTGDCNGDGDVTVDEIVTGVNIALGSLPVSNCLAMDESGDGEVTVDEILRAINAALNGCA